MLKQTVEHCRKRVHTWQKQSTEERQTAKKFESKHNIQRHQFSTKGGAGNSKLGDAQGSVVVAISNS